jgi:hypothetical protein
MTLSDAASGASSARYMNGYASENRVFLFCEGMTSVEKNGSTLLGKDLCQGY